MAFLGHLVRRRGLVLRAEDPELQGALDTLRAAVDPARVLDSPPAEVDVVPVSRDASRWAALPEPTWMVAFGWYMRQVFDVRNDLPFHAAIRPIFLSFHIDRPKILTPPAVAYLRAHGPVGCSDWTTVDLLLSHGVDAFFSGCLTTTVDITAGRRAPGEGPSVDGDPVLVDVRGQGAGEGETQILPELRGRPSPRTCWRPTAGTGASVTTGRRCARRGCTPTCLRRRSVSPSRSSRSTPRTRGTRV